MGTCNGNKVIESEPDVQRNKKRRRSTQKLRYHNSLQYGANSEKRVPDMEEWPGERYSGIGIKRMKGYKCSLPIDKLNEKRNEFWYAKINRNVPNYHTWRVINQACVYDECK
jgi:hypothetical protein